MTVFVYVDTSKPGPNSLLFIGSIHHSERSHHQGALSLRAVSVLGPQVLRWGRHSLSEANLYPSVEPIRPPW
jgi:hypothetical protein